jgi:hypothetical protein
VTVRDSSIEAFRHLLASGTYATQQDVVRGCVRALQPCTRRMVASETGIETASVASAVNALVKDGTLEESVAKRRCKVTGRWVYYLRIMARQEELWGVESE